MIKQSLIDTWFTHHPPQDSATIENYGMIRAAGKEFADVINRICPDGPDKSVAIRCIRDAVMNANCSVACAVDGIDPATIGR